ncbi:MAG: metalloregulator ArsR/SmtB family transcription factor [bacterium]|nr:metalloregulator ArsR/SmtB family transcription factor [bacterium]MDZ4205697.1 metalloregulator ArsR/SmtB family transcription factor [Patescibacteria group bacterium]
MKEKELEKMLKALANRRRLAIISLLRKRKEVNVGEIAETIHLSIKSTSRHLAILFGADILEREQRSSEVFYRLNNFIPDVFSSLIKSL